MAALPPIALLLSVELLMLVARRCLDDQRAQRRASVALDRAEAAPDTRTRVLMLLEQERITGQRITGKDAGVALGVSARRAQELLRELRPSQNGGPQ